MIEIIRYNKKDIEILNSWTDQIGWKNIDPRLIPPTAFFAYKEGKPIAFGSCYLGEGCSFSRLGVFLADNNQNKKLIMKSFLKLFEVIKNEVVESGRDVIYYATNNKFMLKVAEMSGMKKTEDTTSMIMSIQDKVNIEMFLDEK